MGNKEEDASAKATKPSPTQEQPPPSSPATVFPDWASFQAYYNSAGTPIPPGFYHSPVASSPQGHPYMWGPQHIMPPYGTPPHPYVAMYPPGGLYPHPTIPLVAVAGGAEVDGKSDESKERSPSKRNKGSLGSLNMLTGKNNERDKSSGVSANCVDSQSQSDDSGSDASSEGSDADSQNGSQQRQCHEKDTDGGKSKNTSNAGSESAKAAQNSTASSHVSPIMAIPSAAITAPTTTLNIGMDYWSATSAAVTPIRSKLPITPSPAAVAPARDVAPSEMWLQDERELKRQRRKQSNRESARRSRLRKQAEYEDLAHRVGSLNEENNGLREELARIREECEKLASENASLAEKLNKSQGVESRTDCIHGRLESNSGVGKEVDGTDTSS